MKTPSATSRRHRSSSPFLAPEEVVALELSVADRVTHDKFGLGRVESVGDGFVIVAFGAERVRIASPFTRLTHI